MRCLRSSALTLQPHTRSAASVVSRMTHRISNCDCSCACICMLCSTHVFRIQIRTLSSGAVFQVADAGRFLRRRSAAGCTAGGAARTGRPLEPASYERSGARCFITNFICLGRSMVKAACGIVHVMSTAASLCCLPWSALLTCSNRCEGFAGADRKLSCGTRRPFGHGPPKRFSRSERSPHRRPLRGAGESGTDPLQQLDQPRCAGLRKHSCQPAAASPAGDVLLFE